METRGGNIENRLLTLLDSYAGGVYARIGAGTLGRGRGGSIEWPHWVDEWLEFALDDRPVSDDDEWGSICARARMDGVTLVPPTRLEGIDASTDSLDGWMASSTDMFEAFEFTADLALVYYAGDGAWSGIAGLVDRDGYEGGIAELMWLGDGDFWAGPDSVAAES